jgi:hypothetical protein
MVMRQVQQPQPAEPAQPLAAANASPAPEDSNPVHKGFLGSHIDCQI